MAPKLGDVVYVNEVDPYTDEDNVSVAIVTHVFSEKDAGGDTSWWKAAQEVTPVQVQIFRRNGSTDSVTVSKAQTVQDEQGRERWQGGTYSDTPDGPPLNDKPAAPAESPTVAATPPADVTTPAPATVSSQDATSDTATVPASELAAFHAWQAEQQAAQAQSAQGAGTSLSWLQSQGQSQSGQ